MAIGRAVSSFSLLLGLAVITATADYAKVHARLQATPSLQAKRAILRELSRDETIDAELQSSLEDVDLAEGAELKELVGNLERQIGVRAKFQNPASVPGARDAAAKVKSNPLYREPDTRQSGNWAFRSLKRLEDLFTKRARRESRSTTSKPIITGIDRLIVGFVWFVLAAALLIFLIFAVRHFAWKGRLRRQSKALLEEDEPERTLDEWLGLADELAKAGRNREAVRCLYIACLLKFDEHSVARFDRGETNWEHLARIEASPRQPADLEFREPTKAFDRIWYGFKGGGPEDVAQFRAWYVTIADRLRAVAA